VAAFKEVLSGDFEKNVVAAPYEVSEPTIESRVVQLKLSGAQAFLIAGTPKFAAQAIKKELRSARTVLSMLPIGFVQGLRKSMQELPQSLLVVRREVLEKSRVALTRNFGQLGSIFSAAGR
jgi:hypothetical protein